MTEAESPPAGGGAEAPAEAVCVAVNIRPLVGNELVEGCKEVLRVTPGEPQVGCGAHMFTYDHVFGAGGEPTGKLFERCVAPLVDGLFKGYNATVFAYGQTGSGKTFTMGSAFTPGGESRGVIPAVMDAIFARVAAESGGVGFTVRVGFVEIHKEDIHDLLCTGRGPHPAVHIREAGGSVCLAGAAEREVHSRQEMVEALEHGTLLRATAATGMNKQSSRSHAIFTITLEQRRLVPAPAQGSASGDDDDDDDDDEGEAPGDGGEDNSYLCAKMHLVDLAGSERAKRTKAVGARLQEGININRGLLALGNVINALSEGKAHVPYRDSKLTRMLQDSLGGNSRTVMIACVSPADVNLEESLNTLRYANRARNIRNKPMVNRDPVAAQIAQLRQACSALRAENASLKVRLGESGGLGLLDFAGPGDEVLRGAVEDLEAHNRKLQAENQRLQVEVAAAQDDAREATEKMIVAQMQRDRLRQRLLAVDPVAASEAAAEADAIASGTSSAGDVVKEQLERIAELEREVKRLKQVSRLSSAFAVTRRQSMGGRTAPDAALHDGSFHLAPLLSGGSDGPEGDDLGNEEHDLAALELQDDEFVTKEHAHTMEVAEYHSKLTQLMQQLQAKQAAMQSMSEHAALKQRYDERLLELRQHLQELEQERLELLRKLESLQHASEDERLRLRAQYEARIKALDGKVKAVSAKERRLVELEAMKRKADTACAKLQRDIQSIKQQKVSLQRQMEKSSRDFTEWKRQRDRELLQLRKQGRLNAAQLQKVEALHSKQQAVLRRKMEEAEAAKRRIKELEDRKSRLVSRPGTAGSADKPSGADRPFTAPATAATAGSGSGKPLLSGGSGGAVERSSASGTAAAAAAAADGECQPNPMAPLLRDEKGRREWVEGELDAHCATFEYQKILEGERAQRSEVQRKLREVEKALAALKAPEWWPGHITSPNSASEEKLLARKALLLQQREELSQRFEQAQARLMEARAAEDAKGGQGVPADARRWNGVRSVVQARALLKTIFRAASQHKAEAMDAHAQLADLNDEIELLKLRLDIAEQEKCEAEQRVAEAEVLLKQATERAAGPDLAAATPAKQLVPAQPSVSEAPADEGLAEAHAILQQLNVLADSGRLTGGEAGPSGDDSASSSGEDDAETEDEEDESWDEEEGEEEQEQEEQSDDEERHALWDPSQATPARGPKGRRHAARAVPGPASSGSEGRQAARQRQRRSSAGAVPLPEEQPVLNHLNEQLRKAGKDPVPRPTVPLMKAVLKGRVVNGQRWRAGSKKREEIIRDYRMLLGLSPEVESPTAPAAAAAAAAVSSGADASSSATHSTLPAAKGDSTARSRILEHTASSLARCAATQPHRGTQQHTQQQSGPPAAINSARGSGFGSPLPPPERSRAGSASAEGPTDAGTTPVGAEGQQTPEALETDAPPTCRHVGFSCPATDPAADGSGSRQRDLQLQALRDQLSDLELGMNPTGAPVATAAAPSGAGRAQRSEAPPAASPGPRGQSRSGSEGPASQPASQLDSPHRRWWQRNGQPDAAPAADRGRPTRLQASRSIPPDDDQLSSPALLYAQRAEQCKQDAAQASQQIDAALQRSSSGSPSRLARLFGRGGPAAAKQGVAAAVGGAGQEATYDLQVQGKAASAPATGRAGSPLRSSNSMSDGGSVACVAAAAGSASGHGSPSGARDFRISSFSPENRSGAGSPVQQGGLGPAGSGSGGGRPRSGQGQASRAHTGSSPRKQVWKPL